jgi:murein DD-endopeptidase MepM/ murein hydrolase activator NlpD
VATTSTPLFSKTRFTELFVRENALYDLGFERWVFYPGMLFHSLDKWWGDRGKRDKPHEGLDLAFYKDRRSSMHCFDDGVRIPAMYDGAIVSIINDFIGKSIFIEHGPADGEPGRLITIYGHTNPRRDLHVGMTVTEGDVVGTLAAPDASKTDILPHLHVSVGKTSQSVSYDQLDWRTIGVSDKLMLLDPLDVIGWCYDLVETP